MTITKDSPEVQQILASELDRVRGELQMEYDAKLGEAYNTIENLTSDIQATETRLAAAEKVGGELLSRLKEANIKVAAYSESAEGSIGLFDRYETAKKVIEELVARVRQLKAYEARSHAATKLLSEVVARVKRQGLMSHIDRLLANESKEVAAAMKPVLMKCESIAEANEQFSSIKMLNESVSRASRPALTESKEKPAATVTKTVKSEGGLPTPQTVTEQTSLNEGKEPQAPASADATIARSILRRMNVPSMVQ